jgi:hypothetical protein
MELALNLAWLVLAFASYLLLFRRLARCGPKDTPGPNRFQHIIALTCVLAILFPVISLSDDLLEMQVTVEEASLSRLAVKKFEAKHSSTQGQTHHHGLFLIPSFGTGVAWIVLRRTATKQNSHILLCLHLFTATRAPPSCPRAQVS